MAQLSDEAGAVAMDDVCLRRHRRHDLVDVALDQLPDRSADVRVDNRGPANDQADPTRGQPLEVVDVRMGRDSVFHQAGARRQGDEPVPRSKPPSRNGEKTCGNWSAICSSWTRPPDSTTLGGSMGRSESNWIHFSVGPNVFEVKGSVRLLAVPDLRPGEICPLLASAPCPPAGAAGAGSGGQHPPGRPGRPGRARRPPRGARGAKGAEGPNRSR